jgi:two-component system NarL family sensor kinase
MRFAGELHDGVCQKLGAIKLHIETLIIRLAGPFEDISTTLDVLEETTGRLYEVNDEVRGIARGLYPEILTDLGLESALRQLTHDYPTTPISFFPAGDVSGLTGPANLALYRTAQESLENIRKYARASRITLRLEEDEHCVTLTIIDDGIGYDESKCTIEPSSGLGVRNMTRRLENEAVDGKLTINSSLQGTTVTAKVPRKPRNIFLINLFPCTRK